MHENLSEEINSNIAKSAIEGGVWMKDVNQFKRLEVETANRVYTITHKDGKTFIVGHPRYCPKPVECCIHGSTWGGSMLKMAFVGRGMHLEFSTKDHPAPITTSAIKEIREV